MTMICCALLSILRMRKTCDRPLAIGDDLRSHAISDIVESRDTSGAPLRAN
jgi:hypothetical protein